MKYELNDRDLWWEIKDTEAGYTHIAYPSELVSDVLRAMSGEIRKINLSLAKAYTGRAMDSVRAQGIGRYVAQAVAELPDRTSPDHAPGMMLVSASELMLIVNREVNEFLDEMNSPTEKVPSR